MLSISELKKEEYSSPEIEAINFRCEDIITTSTAQGGADGEGSRTDIDNSAWT